MWQSVLVNSEITLVLSNIDICPSLRQHWQHKERRLTAWATSQVFIQIHTQIHDLARLTNINIVAVKAQIHTGPVGGIYNILTGSLAEKEGSPKVWCLRYDTKLHLMVRLLFWRSGEYGVTLHCHYTQVHPNLEWLYLFRSHLGVKFICKLFEYMTSFNDMQNLKKLQQKCKRTRFPLI